MAFWSTNFGEDTNLKDPKRKFRFKVEFMGMKANETTILWMAKTATKPSFQISSAEHKYLNHTFYYPGSVTWQDVTVTMVDPQSPDMAATLSGMIERSGYKIPATTNDLGSMSKAGAAAGVGQVLITQIDAAGNDVEQWTLWNAFITEVKYGDLEYGGDDLTELSVTLKYDWAQVKTDEKGSTTEEAFNKTQYFSMADS